MKLFKNKGALEIMIIALLSSCSSTNVSNDWDCPKQDGYECINIKKADSLALGRLIRPNKIRVEETSLINLEPISSTSDIEKKIWFAPHLNLSKQWDKETLLPSNYEGGL